MNAVASPVRLKLQSQPLKIEACPKCGHEARMDYTETHKWSAWCTGCPLVVRGYVWADTCLKAFLNPGKQYDRSR